ncbi:hypothetical protein AVEN_145228-1 [Araneus ventricosus]|uniref:Uncharacterized protein n=1 Tax=Araneus ventricosus TaxID=182803 RepID=A0A4Y2TZS6_ARAVE|nr:hypothetical protein AVEN_145228-1 [Araneus ventricosus]
MTSAILYGSPISVTTIRQSVTEISFKLRSYGLSFQEFRPLFALFTIVGTGRIDMDRGFVSVSVVSRVMAVNISHSEGRDSGQTASVHPFTRALPRYLPRNGATVQNSTDHTPQVRTSNDSRFAKPHAVGTRLLQGCVLAL